MFFYNADLKLTFFGKNDSKKVNTLTVSRSILLGIILAEPITTSAKFWGFTKVRRTLVTIRMDYNLRTIYIQFRMTQRRTCNMIVLNEIKKETNSAQSNQSKSLLIRNTWFIYTFFQFVLKQTSFRAYVTRGEIWNPYHVDSAWSAKKWAINPMLCQ